MIIPELERAAAMPVAAYDPSTVIAAVNALQPLGKEHALEQIDSCLHGLPAAAYPSGLLWVLRVLFDVPEKLGFPPVVMGTPDVPAPADPTQLPRFPIVILCDIPFLVVREFILFGLPEPVQAHVAYFRRHGVLRATSLTPAANPARLEEELLQLWHTAYGDAYAARALERIREQYTRLERPEASFE
jgi:hypothetical protein